MRRTTADLRRKKNLERPLRHLAWSKEASTDDDAEKTEHPRLRRYLKISGLVFAGLLLLSAALYAVGLWHLQTISLQAKNGLEREIKNAVTAMRTFEPAKAERALSAIDNQIQTISTRANQIAIPQFSSLWGKIIPALKAIPQTIKNIGTASASAVSAASELNSLSENSLSWILNREGEKLIAKIQSIKNSLTTIAVTTSNLQHSTSIARLMPDGGLATLANAQDNLREKADLLATILSVLDTNLERHFAIVFQNPSEMRPGGGFIGSYADLITKKGSLDNVTVTDIYDPDGQLDAKIIPPKPLQGIVTNWAARDANWFFDFPTSAKKILGFLEQSKIYRERLTTFDGLIAMNTGVIEKLLTLTGPIKLPEYDLTISQDNFLREVQKEVEAGKDKRAGEPKRILKTLAPKLLAGLAGHASKKEFRQILAELVGSKDIMIYLKDERLQKYVLQNGIAGNIKETPGVFLGDYLAAINANIGGGKTDAVIKEKIILSSKLNASGKIDNYLTIDRTHEGNKEKDPWYRAINHNYLTVLVPEGAVAEYAAGFTDKKAPSVKKIYATKGWASDPDIENIESSEEKIPLLAIAQLTEFGKTGFAGWTALEKGQNKKTELQYIRVGPAISDNAVYNFIFEKQSGSKAALDITLEAPLGFIWSENQETIYRYVNQNPPGRLELFLKLQSAPPAGQRQP